MILSCFTTTRGAETQSFAFLNPHPMFHKLHRIRAGQFYTSNLNMLCQRSSHGIRHPHKLETAVSQQRILSVYVQQSPTRRPMVQVMVVVCDEVRFSDYLD